MHEITIRTTTSTICVGITMGQKGHCNKILPKTGTSSLPPFLSEADAPSPAPSTRVSSTDLRRFDPRGPAARSESANSSETHRRRRGRDPVGGTPFRYDLSSFLLEILPDILRKWWCIIHSIANQGDCDQLLTVCLRKGIMPEFSRHLCSEGGFAFRM